MTSSIGQGRAASAVPASGLDRTCLPLPRGERGDVFHHREQ